MRLMKTISPRTCKKDLAGLVIVNKSTIMLFHRSCPINATIIRATIKARTTERVCIYTSRFSSVPESDIPSKTARTPDVRRGIRTYSTSVILFHKEGFHEF